MPLRWTLNSPPDKVPFVIVGASNIANGQIAVRWASDPAQAQGARTYYVAMRQTSERLEEADSRECAFGPLMQDLRDIPMPETIIPGTEPDQRWPEPQFQHQVASITLVRSRQADGQSAKVMLTASHGLIFDWAARLFAATEKCWKPMATPAQLP